MRTIQMNTVTNELLANRRRSIDRDEPIDEFSAHAVFAANERALMDLDVVVHRASPEGQSILS